MMQRCSLIGAAGFCATWRAAGVQAAGKLHRIGVAVSQFKAADISGPKTQSPGAIALLAGLRELGYVYGENFVTVPRSSEDKPECFPALAAELVAAQVDVIVALGPALPALKQATSTIPIVITGSSDPGNEAQSGAHANLWRPSFGFEERVPMKALPVRSRASAKACPACHRSWPACPLPWHCVH